MLLLYGNYVFYGGVKMFTRRFTGLSRFWGFWFNCSLVFKEFRMPLKFLGS